MIKAGLLLALQATAASSSQSATVNLDFKMNEEMVRRFDVDRDGALSLGEFQDAMEAELRKAIAATPSSRTKITRTDLTSFRASLIDPFKTFDRNANGSITLEEMRSAILKKSRKR